LRSAARPNASFLSRDAWTADTGSVRDIQLLLMGVERIPSVDFFGGEGTGSRLHLASDAIRANQSWECFLTEHSEATAVYGL
jgi:hypothetical protein